MSEKERNRKSEATHTFWLFGIHAVRDALKNPKREKIRLLLTRNAEKKLENSIEQTGIKTEIVDPKKFNELLDRGSVHQGAALEVKPLLWGDISDTCGNNEKNSVVLLLDRISDPHNVGAILRSAEVFGAQAVIGTQRHSAPETGALAKYIDRGTKGIDFLLRYVLFNVVPTFFEIFLVAGILFYLYGVWYAVVTLTTIGLYSYLSFQITEWRNVFRERMNRADNDVSTKMIDSLLNFETVKYFNNEKYEFHRLDESLKDYELAANQSRHTLSLLNIAQTFIIMVGITIMLVMSVYGIKSGDINVGGFVVINAYMLQLYQPLNWLGSVYREIRQSLTDMENMFSLLEIAPTTKEGLDNMPQNNVTEIRFDKVSFDYDIRRTIIKNVSFSVPNGKKVAIVGPTGAGKSTISRLLFKFYDPKEGSIYINNTNINKISQKSLRKIIGVVPQDTVLFNDTIYYNIIYGNTEASKEEVIRAAQNADIHDFIVTLPDGYETIVGERGLKLSGGEKQRVAIARTILKNPKIFFFDEATSALDTSTEKEIQKNLENVSKDKTTLIIAHRLSTAANADNIIVLDQGAIIEQGTHESLLLGKGKYFEMWGKQKPS